MWRWLVRVAFGVSMLLCHVSSELRGQDVQEWIQARCGCVGSSMNDDEAAALWSYEGALYDPLNGKFIACVEGVEVVQHVATCSNCNSREEKADFQERVKDLQVGSLVGHENATFRHVSTVLSRKFFCYRSTNEEEAKKNALLSHIRLRPNAPLKAIPVNQAVAAYDTATTFIARDNDEFLVHSEWPDGQCLWGRATKKAAQQPGFFDFFIYARRKSTKRKSGLFSLTEPPVAAATNNSTSLSKKTLWKRWLPSLSQRSALIQFGSSGGANEKHKFGVRESYSYSMTPSSLSSQGTKGSRGGKKQSQSSCEVRYTRYGEAPPFYGPGRMCTLELQGRRVMTKEDIPALSASLLQQRVPKFLEQVPTLSLFRNESSSLTTAFRPEEDSMKSKFLQDPVHFCQQQGKAVWQGIASFPRRWKCVVKVPDGKDSWQVI